MEEKDGSSWISKNVTSDFCKIWILTSSSLMGFVPDIGDCQCNKTKTFLIWNFGANTHTKILFQSFFNKKSQYFGVDSFIKKFML